MYLGNASSGFYKLVFTIILLLPFNASSEKLCTYSTYEWSTIERKAVNYRNVKKDYSSISEIEIDEPSGCTVCNEDQIEINIPPLKPFKVCRHLSAMYERELRQLITRGEPVKSIVGYRVGKTRGAADKNGLRTRFSNHSFGIAIDINAEQNGLYDRCLSFGPQCRLIKGGHWRVNTSGSLQADGLIVKSLKRAGLKWGGEIQGKQKDFMHFSPTGY